MSLLFPLLFAALSYRSIEFGHVREARPLFQSGAR